MTISSLFDRPWFLGGATSSEVPGRFPVSIAGHPYQVDLSFEPYRRDAFRHRSIASARPASDINNIPGENSINTEGLWRRTQEDWSHGAGQLFFDRKGNDPAQYHQSKGINPWNQWEFSLLPDTLQQTTSANTNLNLAVAGSNIYCTDGNSVKFGTGLFVDPLNSNASFNQTMTGTPAAAAVGMCSDGSNVWIAYGANSAGLYQSASSGSSATQYVTSGAIDHVAYVKGRLMCTVGPAVYNITATGALPSALYTHPNASFLWSGFAEGPAFIYGAGNAGNQGLVYRFGIATDGTTLVAPIACATLPPGETISSIGSWANTYLLIGTNKGVRFCQVSTSGDLQIGSYVPVNPVASSPVQAFTTWDRFVYFGWSNFDTSSSGLGRLDLSVLIDADTPAFASDLMTPSGTTVQGAVTSVVAFGSSGTIAFAVSGAGVFAQSIRYVPSGYIDSGQIEYDIPDDKIAAFVDCRYIEPMPTGSTSAPAVSTDYGSFVNVGSRTAGAVNQPFSIPQYRGGFFEVRHVLTPGSPQPGTSHTPLTTTPTVTRQILKSLPAVVSGTIISVTLLLGDAVKDNNDGTKAFDINGEYQFLEGLRQSQQIVTYQEGVQTYTVTVDSIDFLPYSYSKQQKAFVAVAVVYLKTLSG